MPDFETIKYQPIKTITMKNKTTKSNITGMDYEPMLAPRTSCMPCFHCKVMQGKLNTPMSFLCFKGKFTLTTNQSGLSKHLDCSLFEYEC